MNNWFTIHGPHGDPDKLPWYIYLQDRHKEIASLVKEGDRVFFYETKTSKHIDARNDIGKMALVRVGYVTGNACSRSYQESHAEYVDGETKNWGMEIPTDAGDTDGYVARERVVKTLGYSNNYYFRGFANGSGIKQISAGQAHELQELFQASRR